MIVFEPSALDDLDRIFELNHAGDPPNAAAHLQRICGAVAMLDQHPFVGRPIRGSTHRELVISHGNSGYLALYQPSAGLVRVVAIRHQRESGYRGD